MARGRVILDGVWKKFRRGERHDSLRDLIPAAARGLLGRSRKASGELEERRGERNAHDRGVHPSVPARGRA